MIVVSFSKLSSSEMKEVSHKSSMDYGTMEDMESDGKYKVILPWREIYEKGNGKKIRQSLAVVSAI